jgi:hypothetical protein
VTGEKSPAKVKQLPQSTQGSHSGRNLHAQVLKARASRLPRRALPKRTSDFVYAVEITGSVRAQLLRDFGRMDHWILGGSESLPHLNQSGTQGLLGASPWRCGINIKNKKKSLSTLPAWISYAVWWGYCERPILTDWSTSPHGKLARSTLGLEASVSLSRKWARKSRIKANVGRQRGGTSCLRLKDAPAARGSWEPRAKEGGGSVPPGCPRGLGGGTVHVLSRRVVQCRQPSPRHSRNPRRLGARHPYISVPGAGAGALPPAATCTRKSKVQSAADTHLRPAASSRGRRLWRPLPPLTGNSCGLRATKLAAALAPPVRLSIGGDSPTPPKIGWLALSFTAPPFRTPPCTHLPLAFKPWRLTSTPPLASPEDLVIGEEAGRAHPLRAAAYSLFLKASRGPSGAARARNRRKWSGWKLILIGWRRGWGRAIHSLG